MQAPSGWDELVDGLKALQRKLTRSKSTNVSSSGERESARGLVQLYFRRVRPELTALGLIGVDQLDERFQAILTLANRVSRRSTHLRTLKEVLRSLEDLEHRRDIAIGSATGALLPELSNEESRIIGTLHELLPSAELSYRQAITDIASAADRLSFRGTVAELREALRSVLDLLAPDETIEASPGFKPEKGQEHPTMRQKVRFVLRSRKRPDATIDAATDATDLVDERTASLFRSIYSRAAKSTHSPPTISEVRQVKLYIDVILVDLLEV
jgi:hypothetical protein